METSASAITRKKLMIVEDEVDLCMLMRAYYLRKGYEVQVTHSLSEALQVLFAAAPEIVVVSKQFCGDEKTLMGKILQAAPNVKVIICGRHTIYGNADAIGT